MNRVLRRVRAVPVLIVLLGLHEFHGPGRASAQAPPPGAGCAATYRNPLKRDGADPWLTYHGGWYYLATTSRSDVRLRRSRRLHDLEASPRSGRLGGRRPLAQPRSLGAGIPPDRRR